MLQKTIKKAVSCESVGLHGGRNVRLTFRPAPENTGARFRILSSEMPSDDNRNGTILTLRPDAVVSTGLATTIGLPDRPGDAEARVATVEHALAALAGLEIDNVLIEVAGGETPLMDGSAQAFVEVLSAAGVKTQQAPRKAWALTGPLSVEGPGKYVHATPSDRLVVDYSIDFPHPAIGAQRFCYVHSPEAFVSQVASARTFGFLRDVERLRAAGLALGGSLENVVVLDDAGVMNPGGLRFADELVRHKILDFLGDLSLFGAPVRGHFRVHASGHGLNNEFVRTLHAARETALEPVHLWPFETPEVASAGFGAFRRSEQGRGGIRTGVGA